MTTAIAKTVAVSLLMLAWLPGSAAAQCVPTMSFNQCWNAIDEAARAAAQTVAQADVSRTVDTINTGDQSNEETATDDFNPKMQLSADTLGATGDDGGGIAVSWTDVIFGSDRELESVGQHHKFVVRLKDAELFEPLKNAITDTAVRDELEESLGDFDDVVVDFRLSLDSRKYGRDIQRHSDLIDEIQGVALASLPEIDTLLEAEDQVDQIFQEFRFGDDDDDKPMNTLLDENQVQALIDAAATVRASHTTYATRYAAAMRENGLFDLVDLVNNQPQLIMSVEGRVRDDLAGPDQTSLKFSYEFGRANVNAFRSYRDAQRATEIPSSVGDIVEGVAAAARLAATTTPMDAAAVAMAANNAAIAAGAANPDVAAAARAVAAAAAESAIAAPLDGTAAAAAASRVGASRIRAQPCATTASCLRRFIDENRASIRQGDRLAFSLAFIDNDDFHYDQGGLILDVPAERSLVAQVSYGRYLGMRTPDSILGGRRSRIDFTASFEDVKDDPARQNRSLANVTFSQEVSQGLFLTVGLVWANKPEYRGAVEEELSARAGVNYKLASSQQ